MEPARVAWWKQTITTAAFSSFCVLMWGYNHAFLSLTCFGLLKGGLNIVCQNKKSRLGVDIYSSEQSSDQHCYFNSPVVYEFQRRGSIRLLFMHNVHSLLFDLGLSQSSHLQYKALLCRVCHYSQNAASLQKELAYNLECSCGC